jgi:diguanylate cyclase (GGDEF)-like protein
VKRNPASQGPGFPPEAGRIGGAGAAEGRESMQSGSAFVRKYMTGIFLVILVVVVGVFWGFYRRSVRLLRDQLVGEGRAFFQEVVLTREWVSRHGGVYVKWKPGMEVNPVLLTVPGLKVFATDAEGVRYVLKNPSLVTREISQIAREKGIYTFRITSLRPINPANAADPFEAAALRRFERGEREVYGESAGEGGRTFFRYMAPLFTEKDCLACHRQQGYREGDIRGGISMAVPVTEMDREMRRSGFLLAASAAGILLFLYAVLRFIALVFARDMDRAERLLVEMATTDFLTGLYNRREQARRLEEELSRSDRSARPLSVLMIDIDHFKKVNDTFGHEAGDLVLKTVARMLRDTMRDFDLVSRHGGEEFLVISPDTALPEAMEIAERLRAEAAALSVPCGGSGDIRLTISLGVAQRLPGEGGDALVARADAALYEAKQAGRNRVSGK